MASPSKSPTKVPIKRRPSITPYSVEDETNMWNFLLDLLRKKDENPLAYEKQPLGSRLWEDYVDPLNGTRTVDNLRTHFRKVMIFRLHRSNLSCADMMYLYRKLQLDLDPKLQEQLQYRFNCKIETAGKKVLGHREFPLGQDIFGNPKEEPESQAPEVEPKLEPKPEPESEPRTIQRPRRSSTAKRQLFKQNETSEEVDKEKSSSSSSDDEDSEDEYQPETRKKKSFLQNSDKPERSNEKSSKTTKSSSKRNQDFSDDSPAQTPIKDSPKSENEPGPAPLKLPAYQKNAKCLEKPVERIPYSPKDHEIMWCFVFRALRKNPEEMVQHFRFWTFYVEDMKCERTAGNVSCHFVRQMLPKLYQAEIPAKLLFELYKVLRLSVQKEEVRFLKNRFDVNLELSSSRTLVNYKLGDEEDRDFDVDAYVARVIAVGYRRPEDVPTDEAPPPMRSVFNERRRQIKRRGKNEPVPVLQITDDPEEPVIEIRETKKEDAKPLLHHYFKKSSKSSTSSAAPKKTPIICIDSDDENFKKKTSFWTPTEVKKEVKREEPLSTPCRKKLKREASVIDELNLTDEEEAELLKFLHRELRRSPGRIADPFTRRVWDKFVCITGFPAPADQLAVFVRDDLCRRLYKADLPLPIIIDLYSQLALEVDAAVVRMWVLGIYDWKG
ncbi:unnamed protein product, partial [Caenorhabditis auriculariae]